MKESYEEDLASRFGLRRRAARGALAALPEFERDAFVSHELRGESFAHIGRRRGCCASTALAACRRASQSLARDLIELRYTR